MLKRLSLIATLALFSGACAPDETGPSPADTSATMAAAPTEAPPTAEAEAEPAEYEVYVDGRAEGMNAAFLAYFPKSVEIHAGDTVTFELIDTGEPHTVTFGSLVDEGMAAVDMTDPTAPEPEQLAVLPVMLPEGPGDAVQSAAQPCFLAEGEPGEEACAEEDQEQPEFDGTQTYYNSGWMTGDEPFSVTFAEDIEPGTYNFLCLLHRAMMSGTVTVVEADDKADTPDEAAARGQTELDAMAAALKPAVDAAKAAEPDPEAAMAGVGSPDAPLALDNEFIAEDLTIAVGDSVTWTFFGPHTVTFNAPEDARTIRVEDEEGGVHLNEKAIAPAGGSPGMPPPPEGEEAAAEDGPTPDPNAPPPPPVVVDGGEWDGEGFYNSGVFISFPPQLFAFKLAFTKAGTYTYMCTVHPDMEGTVTVE